MRMSDWSLDVCSSDLPGQERDALAVQEARQPHDAGFVVDLGISREHGGQRLLRGGELLGRQVGDRPIGMPSAGGRLDRDSGRNWRGNDRLDGRAIQKIGRASCREKGWQYV